MRKIALLALCLLSLSACNSSPVVPPIVETPTLFTSDFAEVCNATPLPEAAAYTEEAGIHPVILFDRMQQEPYLERSFALAENWQVDWQEAEKYQLVSCVSFTPKEKSGTCDFDVEGETYTLDLYPATYTVDLYAAQSGAKLASTSLDLPAAECPSMHYFTEKTEAYYPDYIPALSTFLTPYVQK
ncbi:hypothetical protein IPG41_03635 [Candidatus Peregrinibacteria bacterium]|nr:MAG: hypothetical protein IPG41_03635 [Candidatus Peregrinibacteria bacterium]